MQPGGEIQLRVRDAKSASPRRASAACGFARNACRNPFLIAILLLLTLPKPANALFGPIYPSLPSLEWKVESTPLIVRGTIRPGMCRKITTANSFRYEVTLDVTQVIKGGRHEQVTFITSAIEGLTEDNKSWIDVLAFLRPSIDSTKANAGSTALTGWIGDEDHVFVLADHTHTIIQMDGSTISNGESLLQATLKAAKFAADRGTILDHPVSINSHSLEISLVQAPKDGRLQALARRWLTDQNDHKRFNGVTTIRYFDSPENAALLRTILAADPFFRVDPSEDWTPRLEERWWKEYPVREQALNVLSEWKQSRSADAEIRTPFLRYTAIKYWPLAIALSVILLAALWRLKRKGFTAFTTITLTGLSLLAVFAWCRSAICTESFSYAAAGADFELVSGKSRIALLRVQDDAPPHSPAIRRYTSEETPGNLWFAQYLTPRESAGRPGLCWSQGVTKNNAFSYTLVEIPYWLLTTLLLTLPASRAITTIGRSLRKQRRIKQNRCAACGYDLRSSPGRCPECGTSPPAQFR